MKTKPKAKLAYGAPQCVKKWLMIENANNALYLALHTHKVFAGAWRDLVYVFALTLSLPGDGDTAGIP